MKRKIISLSVALMLAVMAMLFVACGGSTEPEKKLSHIKVTTPPTKVVYEEGETFDKTGMVVTAYYEDESTEVITDYTVDTTTPLKPTSTTYKIEYKDRKATQLITVTQKGNNDKYSLENTARLEDNELTGKTYYFLGSSVTYGERSHGESMADYIAKRNGSNVVKEAVGGTTLATVKANSYVYRIKNFDTTANIDAFICQLSTNDLKNTDDQMGDISQSFDIDDFNTATTYGAIEYIIAYAKQTWNSPVVFYTNSYFENETYTKIVAKLLQIAEKWDIAVLDLYNDTAFNSITDEQRTLYMHDMVHPNRAGYREWWTPKFEEFLTALGK